MVEKKYLIANIGDKVNADGAEVIYQIDTPFSQYLFDEATKQGKTNISDRKLFNRNMEIYKALKQATYFDCEKVRVSVLFPDKTYELTKEEAELVCEAYERKVTDIDEIIPDVKTIISELHKEPKIVVYTCITGGYDSIKDPKFVTPGVDYVCFTDNMAMKSKVWKFRKMPEELKGYSNVKQQRGVKILAHRYLSEYDISVWVDGAVLVLGNIKEYLKSLDMKQYSVFIPEHPARKCIYAEKDACVKIKKIKGDEIIVANKQMARYKEEGYPANFGLVQSNIMVRKHNDQYSKDLMEKWWSELKDNSHRDQLSFNYALWKCGSDKFKYLIKTTCNSRVFNWLKSHNKK